MTEIIQGCGFTYGLISKLREFMEFHFEGRYPDATKAFYKKCTKTYTVAQLKEIKNPNPAITIASIDCVCHCEVVSTVAISAEKAAVLSVYKL